MYADVQRGNARAQWIAAEASKVVDSVRNLFRIVLLTAQGDPRFEAVSFGISHRPADNGDIPREDRHRGHLPCVSF